MPPKDEDNRIISSSTGRKVLPPNTCSPAIAKRPAAEKSNYQMIKEGGWGDRPSFQYSFGLKMTPEDIEEGNQILESFRQADIEAEEEEKRQKQEQEQNCGSSKGGKGSNAGR